MEATPKGNGIDRKACLIYDLSKDIPSDFMVLIA